MKNLPGFFYGFATHLINAALFAASSARSSWRAQAGKLAAWRSLAPGFLGQKRFLNLWFLLLACTVVAACSPVRVPTRDGLNPQWMETPEDLRTFPQNLEVFAKAAGPDRLLMDRASQDQAYARFVRTFFGPWHMRKTSISTREVSPAFRNARGYKDASMQWTQQEWDYMRLNANLRQFPSRATPAITLRNTGLRELPTDLPRFSEPTANIQENPFDYFQYSLLPPGTPVLIAHTTLDGSWHYIECPIAGGWVNARDLALADEEFRNSWESGSYAAILRDNVVLPGTGQGGGDGKCGIGTVLPVAAPAATTDINVLIPLAGPGGYARMAETTLTSADAAPMPLPLTPALVALVGNQMLGQPYGWGGTNGDRDCSAMIRDLFTPFGIWLPRNSAAQARRGIVVPLENLSAQEKADTITREGVPFLSLVGMRGHIALYVGKWHERPAIFHNVWGVRVIKDGNDDERCVIGRAVVTSITPGAELKNLYRPVTFVDRLRTLSTPQN